MMTPDAHTRVFERVGFLHLETPRALEGISMRRIALPALVVGLALAGWNTAQATEMPAHWMNPHCPFIIHNCYWHPGGYMIWGPTDIVYPQVQPVNHIGPPPFGPSWWYRRPQCGPCDNGMCYSPNGLPMPQGMAPPPAAPGAPGAGAPGRPPAGPGQPGDGKAQGNWFRSPRDYFMYTLY